MRLKLLFSLALLTYSLLRVPALALQIESHQDQVNESIDTLATDGKDGFKFGLSAMTVATSNKQVPFWMRSNQFGSIPLEGPSISLIGSIGRDYSKNRKKKLTDWGAYIEPRFNVGKRSELLLIEGYVKGRLGIFQLKAGRSRDMMGLVDSTLSSGAFSVSGNSLGIPKVELSIPDFWDLPYLKKIIAVKGNFVHGWLGNTSVINGKTATSVNTFFHQKSFYARFGKPTWSVKVYGGFNHQVFWGNERQMNSHLFKLSVLETYKRVVLGQSYGGDDVGLPRSKVGNHLGSIDQALEVEAGRFTINGYHQFFFEVGGLYHLNNIKDGIFGLSLANKHYRQSDAIFRLEKVLVEYINTTSQGGEADAKITPSGDEDYYNNFIYDKGWTYQLENIGNPLLTSSKYARKNLPAAREFFVNNRVKAFQLGSKLSIANCDLLVKLTYSLNYGTYGTSPLGHSLNTIRIPSKPPYFGEEKQFSGFLQVQRRFRHGLAAELTLAFDNGTMIYNSSGGTIGLSKSW